jgi:prepilin-type N-terminal cleavage/methylation domain-containing protein
MRRSKGFTLVELLIVVIVLSVLTSVVVGVVPAATTRAKEAAFGATLAVVQSACDRFYAETNVYPSEIQPEAGQVAGAIALSASDSAKEGFLGGYVQFAPNDNPVDLGLRAADGERVYYGVTASGRVFATQAEPSQGGWTEEDDVPVYTQNDVSGTLSLTDIL